MPTTTTRLREMKLAREPITMITAYDHPSAILADRAGVELLLVGDSLGNTVLGHQTTVPVTMADMLHHTRAVARAVENALVVADLPFMSYHLSPEETMRNAGALMQAGAHAVKLEGGAAVAESVARLVEAGVPVMGHVGLTPQSVHALGGFKLQAKTPEAAGRLVTDVLALEAAGAFAIVLELVPAPLAAHVSRRLAVPTIGIGAGAGCDGQVQVWHDLLGFGAEKVGRHAKRYADLNGVIAAALSAYRDDVRAGIFPEAANAFEGTDVLKGYLDGLESLPSGGPDGAY